MRFTPSTISAVAIVLELFGLASAQAPPVPFDAAPLDQRCIQQITEWLPPTPRGLGRPITDRQAWERVGQLPACKDIVQGGTDLLQQHVPQPTDELYLDFSKTGNRTRYERPYFALINRFSRLVLAECIENQGRFLPAIEATARNICNLTCWTLLAHDGELQAFQQREFNIDLFSSEIGWTLGSAYYLLGDAWSPDVRKLVRDHVGRRVLSPMRQQLAGQLPRHSWLMRTNNWNAVCLANVTGAALALVDDPSDRALFVAAAEHYVQNYLNGFTPDGFCDEGMSYWNYGFGHYVLLAEIIDQATQGRIDLLAQPRARAAATYAWRIQLEHGVCPPFSDCSIDAKADAWIADYLGRKLRTPIAVNVDEPVTSNGRLPVALATSFESSASKLPAYKPVETRLPVRSWFDDAQVLVARRGHHNRCRLALALKGGHNDESHNHNDVGSYVIVVDGVIVMSDPGSEVYTQRTFSARRYESVACNSFGHPVVAGQLQRVGREAQARVLRTDFADEVDSTTLDLAAAYDVVHLKSLQRTFVFDRRDEGSVSVADAVEFTSPQSFEISLITLGDVQRLAPDRLRFVRNKRVIEGTVGAAGDEFDIVISQLEADFRDPGPRTRVGIRMRDKAAKAAIKVTMIPR